MAAKNLAVVAIHGMGSQEPGFAGAMFNELDNQILPKDRPKVAWKEVFWGDLTEPRQDAYLRATEPLELDQVKIRKFVITAFGDAVAYQRVRPAPDPDYHQVRQEGTYFKIHERIAEGIKELYEKDLASKPVPLVVLAHSLGGHIFSNYYWDVRHPGSDHTVLDLRAPGISTFERLDWLAGFVTFGCNIPLFTFALDNVEPIAFPSSRLPARYKPHARWLNFYDPDDVLGYPLRPLGRAYARVVSEDTAIDVGNPFVGWTPISHTKYWTDADMTRPVAKLLNDLLGV
jgi:hypothetical protein